MKAQLLFVAMIVSVVAVLSLGLVDSSRAQVIATTGGMQMGGGSGVMGLLFQLSSDEKWQDAKHKLIERANKGDAVPIVFHAQQMRGHQGEKVVARLDALLGALEEAGHYPLTQETISAQIAQLEELLVKVQAKNPSEKVLGNVAISLHRAQTELTKSVDMIETGKLPQHGGRVRVGRVRATGTGN